MRSAALLSEGRLSAIVRRPTGNRRAPDEILRDLCGLIDEARISAGLLGGKAYRLALGVPTTFDESGALALSDNLPTLTGLHLGRLLQDRIQQPVRMFNDAACFAAGEWRFGSGRNAQCFCGVTLGTGIGLGIMLNGTLHRGAHTNAGEIWKSPMEDDILETFVCGKGIERDYARRSGRQLAGNEIFERCRAGDPNAQSAYDEFGRRLGIGLSYLINILDPECIAFGGSVAEAFDYFQAALRKTVTAGTVSGDRVRLEKSALGDSAALLGAAHLANQTE